MSRSLKKDQIIEWDAPTTELHLSPKLPQTLTHGLSLSKFPELLSHVWLASSGSTEASALTLYALSKKSFLVSAKAVNRHLKVKSNDVWLNVLPTFHVGGIGVIARAHVSQTQLVNQSMAQWSPAQFISWVEEAKATLTSLVPTQLFDLVKYGQRAPSSLRAIVIGGAKLEDDLFLQARKLGYPVLPSYGMTEMCSQIATADLSSLKVKAPTAAPPLKMLSHVEAKVRHDGFLVLKSRSLFTAKALWRGFGEPEVLWRKGDWFVSSDRAQLRINYLIPLGRSTEQVKISGELVDIADLRSRFHKVSSSPDFALLTQADSRRGNEVILVLPHVNFSQAQKWVGEFNVGVLPVAKIRNVYYVNELPKTDLGKIISPQLKKTLGFEA